MGLLPGTPWSVAIGTSVDRALQVVSPDRNLSAGGPVGLQLWSSGLEQPVGLSYRPAGIYLWSKHPAAPSRQADFAEGNP